MIRPLTEAWSAHFDIDPFVKKCLLEGLDDIALTLGHEDAITSYEQDPPQPLQTGGSPVT